MSGRVEMDGSGRLSDSDNSSSGHTSEDEGDNEGSDGHPIMSIFASYYGIEEAPTQENKPRGTIDDAGFQPEQYVKVWYRVGCVVVPPAHEGFSTWFAVEPAAPGATRGACEAGYRPSAGYPGMYHIYSVRLPLPHLTPSLLYVQTLDGEMQKLVYDNYNKFITATETIRVMKADVYGMDPDMEAVRWVSPD
jgi:hypothetical protein